MGLVFIGYNLSPLQIRDPLDTFPISFGNRGQQLLQGLLRLSLQDIIHVVFVVFEDFIKHEGGMGTAQQGDNGRVHLFGNIQ